MSTAREDGVALCQCVARGDDAAADHLLDTAEDLPATAWWLASEVVSAQWRLGPADPIEGFLFD